ncbi:hypothetical protein HPNQ4076_0697 [Helicobacter pylori NQ4076]|uniref:Uncharacterized protein n=1 Tax=Helicobacter pylori NQ4076 TaxID=992029 RepID=I9QN02_HELPX|nr:hypothetical protein HPNQ4076_0697 [Helicobacter pylori NQ4076]
MGVGVKWLYSLKRIFILIPPIKKRQKLQFNDFNPTAA